LLISFLFTGKGVALVLMLTGTKQIDIERDQKNRSKFQCQDRAPVSSQDSEVLTWMQPNMWWLFHHLNWH